MVGYDFDKTIYAGDSSTDFFVFMLLHRPYLLLLMPYFCVVFLLYGTKVLSKKMTKQALFFYVPTHKNIDKLADKFWEKNIQKIYSFYKLQQKEDDIIISASLDFVFEPAMKLLGEKLWVKIVMEKQKLMLL
ncbi:MAG: haloacid dehalogenase-like hydrolase [Clostridia bacterium]|nr:haloacid dehalogenase-like hydrolase [Clostridia bacterium]